MRFISTVPIWLFRYQEHVPVVQHVLGAASERRREQSLHAVDVVGGGLQQRHHVGGVRRAQEHEGHEAEQQDLTACGVIQSYMVCWLRTDRIAALQWA